MSKDARVFVVDDDEAMRTSLRWLLESAGIQVDTYENADSFLQHYNPTDSGCLLVDVRMPGMSGLELQRFLNSRGHHLPVIVITGHGDIEMAVKAMKAGAVDFIEKPFHDEALLQSIQHALTQCQQNQDDERLHHEIMQRVSSLTPREREVMRAVIDGKSNKEIATMLDVSIKTVEAHRARVMEKTSAKSLAELVRLNLQLELLSNSVPK